ncbi:MAG: heavy metal translocating P-type ATPase [Planctomycetota bacterium]
MAALREVLLPLVHGREEALGFDLLAQTLLVEDQEIDSRAVEDAVKRAGLTARRIEPTRGSESEVEPGERGIRTATTVASGALAALGFGTHAFLAGDVAAALGSEGLGVAHDVPLAARAAYLGAILLGGWAVAPKALAAARNLRPDMNLLMTIAVVGAVAIGEWLEAAVVTFLFAVSLALEAWSVGRARRAVRALLALAPPVVHRRRPDGRDEDVAPEDTTPGDRFVVRPGERIPLDGEVVAGTSSVDQAPITGESVPVEKGPGAEVFAGTINATGALEVVSTRPAGDTLLARIAQLVGAAQGQRAPTERWVESFAAYYTPTVLVLAALVACAPPLVLGGAWTEWAYRGLVLLVIGCPCALVISTPVSIVAALAAAARHGVLLKGGAHVESPARLVAVALDKTGTLTEGRPSVRSVEPLNDHDERSLLEIALALEAGSDHPLARAIVRHAEAAGVSAAPATDLQALHGKGLTARVNGEPYWLGSHRLLEERGQETPEVHARLEALSGAGQSVVVLGNDTHVCGFIALADGVRPEAAQLIADLRAAGVQRVVMLTGDNAATAQAIGRETGVDEVRAELLPEDKVRAIEALVEAHGQVAMVGDGVNDAPALARATIGVAMGAAGSDAAIETADVALMSDDLSKLPWLIRHSRRALSVIRQNVVVSLSVKAVFAALTLFGLASLWAAIAADMGASLVVIANGLRLLRDPRSGGPA